MNSKRRVFHGIYLCCLALLLLTLYLSLASESELLPRRVSAPVIALDPLYAEVRVLCLVPYVYWSDISAARYIKRTWGQHCNVLLFVSGDQNDELEPYIPVWNATDNWLLVRSGLIHAYEYYKYDMDWLLRVEDYSFVVMENLRQLLQKYSPSQPIQLGYELNDNNNMTAVYHKAGYVLSKESLRRFTLESKRPNTTHCSHNQQSEHIDLNRCLRHVGVSIADSRDAAGHETFTPIKMVYQFIAGFSALPWLQNMSRHRVQSHTADISKSAITFRVDYPPEIYQYYYFVYHVQLFGLPLA